MENTSRARTIKIYIHKKFIFYFTTQNEEIKINHPTTSFQNTNKKNIQATNKDKYL